MYSLAAEAFARGEGRRRDASSGSQNPGRHRLMLNGSPDPGAFLGPNLGPLSEWRVIQAIRTEPVRHSDHTEPKCDPSHSEVRLAVHQQREALDGLV